MYFVKVNIKDRFRVLGSGFWVQGSGFWVLGSGFRGSGFWVQRFRVLGSEVRGSTVQDLAVQGISNSDFGMRI